MGNYIFSLLRDPLPDEFLVRIYRVKTEEEYLKLEKELLTEYHWSDPDKTDIYLSLLDYLRASRQKINDK